MKKILIYLLILLVGIALGYSLNSGSENEDITEVETKEIQVKKTTKQVDEQIIQTEKILEVPLEIDSIITSGSEITVDTLLNDEAIFEATEDRDKEEDIIMEELVSQRTIKLGFSPNDSSDVSEMLELKSTSFSNYIVIEFWQSPLSITGYELTRNRLKLFGFNPNESITLQLDKNEEQILLNTDSMSIVLKKSKQFKTLKLR